MPTNEQLKELQSKTLEQKIQISIARIIEWYENWGGQVYVSFSGGKDSTVLLDLVRRIYPDVPAVFSDTGLEFPELREFVKNTKNVIWVKPQKNFVAVLTEEGYPIISKDVAMNIKYAQKSREWAIKRFDGLNKDGSENAFKQRYKKYKPLINADFLISDKCCDIMKKEPIKKYEKESGRHPYIGNMAVESTRRTMAWIQTGCNAFNSIRPISTPIAFWTEQDVLRYIQKYNLPYASIYGDLIEVDDKLKFTQYKRTGCVFCGFGCHLQKEPNNFQMLKKTHPQLYNYCMRGGKFNEEGKWVPDKGLGMAPVLNYIGVETDWEGEREFPNKEK